MNNSRKEQLLVVLQKLQNEPKFKSYRDLLIAALCFKSIDISGLWTYLEQEILGMSIKEANFIISVIYDIPFEITNSICTNVQLKKAIDNENNPTSIGPIEDELRRILKASKELFLEVKELIQEKQLEKSNEKIIHLFDDETKYRVSEILKSSYFGREINECNLDKIFSIFYSEKRNKKSFSEHITRFLDERYTSFVKDETFINTHIDTISYPNLSFTAIYPPIHENLELIPSANHGAKIQLELLDIIPYKRNNFAVLKGITCFGEELCFVDSSYFKNKEKYIIGKKYYFNLCAITYSWEVRSKEPIICNEEVSVLFYKERDMDVPYDENGKIKPFVIKTDNLHSFMNMQNDVPELYYVISPVERLREIITFDEEFYLFDINRTYQNYVNDEEFRIPCFALKKQSKQELHESDSIAANIWLQGHLDEFGIGEVVFSSDGTEKSKITVEIADEPFLQNRGFINRFYIPEETGMFYIFEEESIHHFVTTGVGVFLSVAYIKADGTICEIIDRKPNDNSVYANKEPVKYILEVPQGYFEHKGISVGDKVQLNE